MIIPTNCPHCDSLIIQDSEFWCCPNVTLFKNHFFEISAVSPEFNSIYGNYSIGQRFRKIYINYETNCIVETFYYQDNTARSTISLFNGNRKRLLNPTFLGSFEYEIMIDNNLNELFQNLSIIS